MPTSSPGDPEALAAELRQLHPQSFGWALSCCGQDREDAEDVLQTAYLKILDGRARFAGRSSLRTWLFSVIRRTAADHGRARARRRARIAELREAPRPRPAHGDDTVSRLAARALLAGLAPRQREVLQLVFYHGCSLAEAAAVMAIGVGSARTHYHRGKRTLRAMLDQEREMRRA